MLQRLLSFFFQMPPLFLPHKSTAPSFCKGSINWSLLLLSVTRSRSEPQWPGIHSNPASAFLPGDPSIIVASVSCSSISDEPPLASIIHVKLVAPGLPGTSDYAGDYTVIPSRVAPWRVSIIDVSSGLWGGQISLKAMEPRVSWVTSKGFLLWFWARRAGG